MVLQYSVRVLLNFARPKSHLPVIQALSDFYSGIIPLSRPLGEATCGRNVSRVWLNGARQFSFQLNSQGVSSPSGWNRSCYKLEEQPSRWRKQLGRFP